MRSSPRAAARRNDLACPLRHTGGMTRDPADTLQRYLVGGAVRDALLGLPVHERDWVVVGTTPEAMQALGFTPVGKDFPVFLHPQTKEEYALARTERKSGHGYGGFTFHADASVTLEEDLRRRDLTMNAMAQAADGTLIDPYHGQQDLEQRILRHVSPAFVEDPLRVLRIARFHARFAHLGFTIADETQALMRELVDSGELDHLVAERVWKETSRALMEASPDVYFRTLNACGALKVLFPEVAALDGVPQRAKYHPEVDTFEHLMLCLRSAADRHTSLETRYAVLCHDLGKGNTPQDLLPRHHGHEQRGVPLAKQMSERLKVPTELKELGALTAEYHTHCHRAFELKPTTLQKLLKAFDYARRPERFGYFLAACKADSQGRTGYADNPYPQVGMLAAVAKASKVDTAPFLAQGLQGKQIGQAIQRQQQKQLREARDQWQQQHS